MPPAVSSASPQPTVAVLLPRPLKGPYDYLVPEGLTLARGDVVAVPLGRTRETGVVWGPGSGAVAPAKLRAVLHRYDTPALPEALLAFVTWMAGYLLVPEGEVLALVLRVPDALSPPPPRVAYGAGGPVPERLTAARARVLAVAGEGPARSLAELAQAAGVTPGVVRGLVDAGTLVPHHLPAFDRFPAPQPAHAGPQLSPAQAAAATVLSARLGQGFSVTLLDGVTGSGKTEAYFEAIAAALAGPGQVLILLPEIALTVQFLARFTARFGVQPAEWHSDLSARERRRTWAAVARGEVRVLAGARSALFLPFPQLDLIVVDEEHDGAFKQDEGLIYHARDMAVVRGMLGAAPVILSSATPSLETWVNARQGRYGHVRLPERHGAAVMPAVSLIDLKSDRPEPGRWLAPGVHAAIAETLAAGEQVLLFLNRRGYSPLTLCRACGHRLGCPNCSTWLVEHRYHGQLRCHHCGFSTRRPTLCPQCGAADSLTASGPGVERIAEEVRAAFPAALVALASSDVLHGPRETQAAIRAMAEGGTDILIGTQIVAKGHNFPLLTLVVVVDADLGLKGGDPRARERTFQLLHQVAGRAGRHDRPGRVLVQTTQPRDAVMQALVSGDRDAFLEREAEDRAALGLPPFGRMAALILSGADGPRVEASARALRALAPPQAGLEVWGPAPAALARLRGQTRVRLLVQAGREVRLADYLRGWLASFKPQPGVRVAVDIDPQQFL